MSNASASNEAKAAIATLATLGEKIVSYTGEGGTVETVGYIDQEEEYIGVDARTAERRRVVSLLVEDVPNPRRGDRVTDEAGAVWELVARLPSDDPYVVSWLVEIR